MPQGTTFTAILVTLKDINDNQPHFVRNIHEFEVVEGFYEQPFAVGNVTATDDDGDGRNSRLSYSMRAENKPGELNMVSSLHPNHIPVYNESVNTLKTFPIE